MDPPSILVLGSGELGLAVLHSLAQHPNRNNTSITVLKRPSKSNEASTQTEDFTKLGIAILHADVVTTSEPDLASLLTPFHTVISCNGMFLPSEIQPKIARAALAAGVKRYFPWQFGVDYDVIGPNSSQDLFTTQLEVRALLRAQQRMEWVIVSTGMFTSFLFEPTFGLVDVERRKVTAIGSWENAITVTSPKDIGRVVAELCLVEDAQELKGVVYTAGDTVSMGRLADVVEKTKGWEVERELKTVEMLKEDLSRDPDDGMRKYRVVFGEGVGVAWDAKETFNAQRGIQLQSVDEWARENL